MCRLDLHFLSRPIALRSASDARRFRSRLKAVTSLACPKMELANVPAAPSRRTIPPVSARLRAPPATSSTAALSAAACAATPGADARHRSSWSPEATSAPRAVRRRASPPAQPPLGPGLCPSANGRWAQVQARSARAGRSGRAGRTSGTAPARGGGLACRSADRPDLMGRGVVGSRSGATRRRLSFGRGGSPPTFYRKRFG